VRTNLNRTTTGPRLIGTPSSLLFALLFVLLLLLESYRQGKLAQGFKYDDFVVEGCEDI
jgi:hypothetical protein